MKKNESGRTILEMLAVLAVVALLTLSGLAGYSYLVQKQRRQQAVKDVATLVTGIKTASFTSRRAEGEIIPAGAVVKGPQMDPSHTILELPDSEKSYAVVTNLSNGAFSVELQFEPGTCSEMLQLFKEQDAVLFPQRLLEDEGNTRASTIAEDVARRVKSSKGLGIRARALDDNYELKSEFESVEVTNTDDDGNDIIIDGKPSTTSLKSVAAEVKKAACQAPEGMHLSGASVIFNCPTGLIPYNFRGEIVCSNCGPGGTYAAGADGKGKCCKQAYLCEGRCECPSGTMCNIADSETDRSLGKCVECATVPTQDVGNAACKNVHKKNGKWIWQRHVCNGETNRCIECLTHSDCTDSREGSVDAPSEKAKFCVDNTCIECNADYDGSTGPHDDKVPCLDDKLPMCKKGVCTACEGDQVWDVGLGECVCPVDPATGKRERSLSGGRCGYCLDNSKGNYTDEGCGEEDDAGKPICYDSRQNVDFIGGGTNAIGTTCVECFVDAHCTRDSNKPYCDTTTHTCIGCTTDPANPVWDSDTRTCVPCKDNQSGSNQDSGCPKDGNTTKKLCKPTGHETENGTNKAGTTCHLCRNSSYGANEATTDEGCNSTDKLCEAANGAYADTCRVCKDTVNHGANQDANLSKADAGCSDSGKPMCGTSGSEGAGTYGDKCYKCNTTLATGGKHHMGCSDDTPKCVTKSGKYGDSCTTCPEGKVWVNGDCQVCNDTATGANTDSGCGSGDWKDKPICAARDSQGNAKNDGKGTSGGQCAVCHNYQTGTATDFGCGSGTWAKKPLCNAAQGEFGNECNVCSDTATGASTDTGCGGSGDWKDKPICAAKGDKNDGKGTFGDSCAACVNDKDDAHTDTGCSAEKPLCDAGSGKFGNTCKEKPCSGSDMCIDTINRSGKGKNSCIKVSSFEGIYRGSDGKCTCYDHLKSDKISDSVSCNVDFDNRKQRRTSSRHRQYWMPSSAKNFYCDYKFRVEGEADDYVAGSYPSGISSGGTDGTHNAWGEAHDNWIQKPGAKNPCKSKTDGCKTTTATIKASSDKKEQAWLKVSDRWLREVAFTGYLWLDLANAHGAPHGKTKSGVNVKKGWQSGHSTCSHLGGWRDKD